MNEKQRKMIRRILDDEICLNRLNENIEEIKDIIRYAYSNKYIEPIFGIVIKAGIKYEDSFKNRMIRINSDCGR